MTEPLPPVLTGPATEPTAIAADREQGTLAITWGDGARTEISLADFRRLCPCALCNHRHGDAGERDLERHLSPAESDLKEILPVGRYAISARWRDGHATGIYVFEKLRALGAGERPA